jgi:hypothetical protein
MYVRLTLSCRLLCPFCVCSMPLLMTPIFPFGKVKTSAEGRAARRRAFHRVALTSSLLEASTVVTPLLPLLSASLNLFLLLTPVVLSVRQHSLQPSVLCTFELFPRRFCIYFGYIRRQPSCTGPPSCILSAHLPNNLRFVSSRLRNRSLRHIAWRRLQPLGSKQSTHSSQLRNYELQYNFRRFPYTPQGAQSVLHDRGS